VEEMMELSRSGTCGTLANLGKKSCVTNVKIFLMVFARSEETPVPVASFAWHKEPITSIEWHPTDESSFAASSADGQVSLWDLSVEQDDEEMGQADGTPAVPAQLLFSHQQHDVKEVHWHPQIPGTVISTGLNGFDFFKTISI
jgi:ribosome assembly protein RRB1